MSDEVDAGGNSWPLRVVVLSWITLLIHPLQDLVVRVLYDRAPPSEEEIAGHKRLEERETRRDIGLPDDAAEKGDIKESTQDVSKGKPAPRPRHSPEWPQLKTFLGESWVEFPDSSSPSRVMKAKCVVSEDTMSVWTESVLSN